MVVITYRKRLLYDAVLKENYSKWDGFREILDLINSLFSRYLNLLQQLIDIEIGM